jgi:hypothetical protein
MSYIKEEEEKYILCRIPFTVYFLWKDIRYNRYRVVVKEFISVKDAYDANKNNYFYDQMRSYRYKII